MESPFSDTTAGRAAVTARIAALWVYPVKGMAGVPLQEAKVLPTGIEGDREWLVVDEQLRAVTLRECPRLATLTPTYGGEALALSSAAGDTCCVSLSGEPLAVSLFGQPAHAVAATPETDAWLSNCLARPVRLARFDRSSPRHCNSARFGDATMLFADGAPYLVGSTASLAALDRNRDQRRFRANIWLDGIAPFAEQSFRRLATPSAEWRLVDHCKRCAVILVDPDLGQRTESGRWLLDVAAVNAMPEQPRAPAFGVNTTLAAGAGSYLRVGESVVLS